MDKQIAVMGRVRFLPERLHEVLGPLKAMVEATRRLDGCLAYDTAVDLFEPGLIRISEMWPDLASLRRHTQADHIAPWHQACRNCGMLEKHYAIWTVSPTQLGG